MKQTFEEIEIWDAVNERDHLNHLAAIDALATAWKEKSTYSEVPDWLREAVENILRLQVNATRRNEIVLADIYRTIATTLASMQGLTERVKGLELNVDKKAEA
ncbi:MAG TPA: hypothetical protein PLP45_02370 [Syntrophales bacterium]|nr:hypothetical protein [Syntrophales bacterium]